MCMRSVSRWLVVEFWHLLVASVEGRFHGDVEGVSLFGGLHCFGCKEHGWV
jgi:hypothetical protein